MLAQSVVLGESLSEDKAKCDVRYLEPGRFEATWLDASGNWVGATSSDGGRTWSASKPTEAPAKASTSQDESIFATATTDEGQYIARSGRRIPGIPPAFPSAPLVLSFEGASGLIDLAYVDEPLHGKIQTAALATGPDAVVAVYITERSECRAIRIPTSLPGPAEPSWFALPPFPQRLGVAGIISGLHNGVLIGAGGTNFPEAPPWEGGTRVTYDQLFVLNPEEDAWRPAGRLPAPRAYAALASLPDGLLVAGGENPEGMFQDAFLLQWTGESIEIQMLPDLPQPVTQPAAVLSEGKVYLAGGAGPGSPRESLNQFLCFDPEKPEKGWTRLPTWPGPSRTLAVLAAVEGWIYVVSGLHLGPDEEGNGRAEYLKDAYRYHPDQGWQTLPASPWSATAAPSPAPAFTSTPGFFILGGVDGAQAGKLPRETLLPNDILFFDIEKWDWSLWPQAWPQSVVTSPAIPWKNGWIIPSGEPRGGVRTPNVWYWEPDPAGINP